MSEKMFSNSEDKTLAFTSLFDLRFQLVSCYCLNTFEKEKEAKMSFWSWIQQHKMPMKKLQSNHCQWQNPKLFWPCLYQKALLGPTPPASKGQMTGGRKQNHHVVAMQMEFGALFPFALSTLQVQGSSPFGELTPISPQSLCGCGAIGALLFHH